MAPETKTVANGESSEMTERAWLPVTQNERNSLLEPKHVPRVNTCASLELVTSSLPLDSSSIGLPGWLVFPAETAGTEEALGPNCCSSSMCLRQVR